MNVKRLNIKQQLILGSVAMILSVILLGVISFLHSEKIHEQTELMYQHPYQVRVALQKIETSIYRMRIATRDIMLAKNKIEIQNSLNETELASNVIEEQFKIIKSAYLGSLTEVNDAYEAFLIWKSARKENNRLALIGEIEAIKKSVSTGGTVAVLRDNMLRKIQRLDGYAEKNAKIVYDDSQHLKNQLSVELLIEVLLISFCSVLITIYLVRTIQKPVKRLADAAGLIRNGDMSARCTVEKGTEFGELSETFNSMAEKLQDDKELNEMENDISNVMLKQDEAIIFFQSLLERLAVYTKSQMVAVYLLNEDKQIFEHFESIGLSDQARMSFSAKNFDGEFGKVIQTGTIQKVKSIPLETKFVFNTVSGSIVPREIISIPISSSGKVMAIISMANVRKYEPKVDLLLERIYDTMNARVEGVLTYMKLKEFSIELEKQKRELAAQSLELAQQNAELEIQKNQLGEINRLKTNFLSNMSHELRTPLNSVIALSGVLSRRLKESVPAEEYSYIDVISRNGKHLLSIINEILDISRIESGKEEILEEVFDVQSVCNDIVQLIKPQADENGIELTMTAGKDTIYAKSDETKFKHILQNLISNAVKFTQKGYVEVMILQNLDDLIVSVKDTGIGIDEKDAEFIFEEFRQADGSNSRKYGGTGLGLAIARKYARMLGGDIDMESELNKGSKFTLKLYSVIDEGSSSVQTKASDVKTVDSSIRKEKNKILLVEDSKPAVVQLEDILNDVGYETVVAESGSKAIDALSEYQPDGIILDIMLPDIDGFDVLRRIRSNPSIQSIPVLILTAKIITKEELSFLKSNHVYQLIQKGDIKRSELLKTLDKMMLSAETLVTNTHAVLNPPKNEKILLIDGNQDNIQSINTMLSKLLVAENGLEGIRKTDFYKPDLILLNMELPDMNGVDVFRLIQSDEKLTHIPVMALATKNLAENKNKWLQMGFKDFIQLPIDKQQFFKSINGVLYE